MSSLIEQRQAVLDKLNVHRQVYWHDFQAVDGYCKNCNTHFTDAIKPDKPILNLDMLCSVITSEEVAQFNLNDNWHD